MMDCVNSMAYRDKLDDHSSDSDSSDDNGTDRGWKSSILKDSKSNDDHETSSFVNKAPSFLTVDDKKRNCDLPSQENKRKRNTVWCNVIQEQLVSDDLGQFGLKKKPSGSQDRNCESYDFTRRFLDQRPGKRHVKIEDDDDDDDDDDEMYSKDVIVSKRKPNKHFQKNSRIYSSKYSVKEVEDMKRVAKKIIQVLNEPKRYLIYKVVEILGPQKSLEILKMTENVEDSGGMLIKDNSRRRTPGGVFFQLLKNDPSVTKKMIDEVFSDERKFVEDKKKDGKKKKRRNKRKNMKKKNIKITFDVQMDQDRVVKDDKEDEEDKMIDEEDKMVDEDKVVDEDKTMDESKMDENKVVDTESSCLIQPTISNNLFKKGNSTVIPLSNRDSEIEEGEITD